MPLAGVALQALTLRPTGFPKYRDKATGLSATVNRFCPRTAYARPQIIRSARCGSFKDRLVAAEAPDSLIDNQMDHKTYKPKYGKGPSLELKRKFLELIAFEPPIRL